MKLFVHKLISYVWQVNDKWLTVTTACELYREVLKLFDIFPAVC